MAKSGRLHRIAASRETTERELVLGAIRETGSILRAAAKLDVAPTTIRNWLDNNPDVTVEFRQVAIVREATHDR